MDKNFPNVLRRKLYTNLKYVIEIFTDDIKKMRKFNTSIKIIRISYYN